ncbi:hypothetical protein HHI36_006173, partial [Cryptolaemus montrouzieri]
MGAAKKKWLYVGRIAGQEVLEDDLNEYLADLQDKDKVEIKKLHTKGNNSSFREGAPEGD